MVGGDLEAYCENRHNLDCTEATSRATDVLEKRILGVREDNAPTLVGANHREAVMRILQHAPRSEPTLSEMGVTSTGRFPH